MSFAIGQITDPIVRQFRMNVRLKGDCFLISSPKPVKIAGTTDDRHIANEQDLQPRFRLFSLFGLSSIAFGGIDSRRCQSSQELVCLHNRLLFCLRAVHQKVRTLNRNGRLVRQSMDRLRHSLFDPLTYCPFVRPRRHCRAMHEIVSRSRRSFQKADRRRQFFSKFCAAKP